MDGPTIMEIVSFMEKINILPKSGKALDIGPKHFKDAVALAQLGFDVDTIEPTVEDGRHAIRITNKKAKLEDVMLKNYDVIIANNVLPFTDDAEKQLNRLYDALNPGGVMAFTLFGRDHEWKHLSLSAEPVVPQWIKTVNKREVIGMVPTYSGKPAYWHSYEYIVRKVA